jgi:PTS system mannose-specific IIA component
MIGIVVAAHRELADALLRAAEGIVGPMERVYSVSFNYEDSPEDTLAMLKKAIGEANHDGDGVIVFTDMFGGTPTNMSLQFMKMGGLEIVAGVNLPMLLKAQAARWEMSLKDLTEFLRDYGGRNIIVASDFFGSCGV